MGNNTARQRDMTAPADINIFQGMYGAGKLAIQNKLMNIPLEDDHEFTENPARTECMKKNNLSVLTWVCGNRSNVRPITQHYYKIVDAVVFVVDSADISYIDLLRYELHESLQEEGLKDAVFLILANKQDLPGAMSVSEISKVLQLHKMKQQGTIFGTSALTGEGIDAAADWLFDALDERRKLIYKQHKVANDQCKRTGWLTKAGYYVSKELKRLKKML